ncbi:unnamed protein product [Dicrocoelium dendriticum]|nr:unnamed protein product [Dicrocoelium dendriticum]
MPVFTDSKSAFSLLIESEVELNFLLPNGIILPQRLDSDLSLSAAKDEVWLAAAREPLFDVLLPKEQYVFTGIHRETADEEYFYDQSIRLRELPLLLPYIRVVEATKDSTLFEKSTQDATIASCIGISPIDLEQTGRLVSEVKWARSRLCHLANTHRDALHAGGSEALARYLTAAAQRDLSMSLRSTLKQRSHLMVSAWVLDGGTPAKERRIHVELGTSATVDEALTKLLRMQMDLVQNSSTPVLHGRLRTQPQTSAYVLKVCCSHKYLFGGDAKLVSFEYVQHCIERNEVPCLSPMLLKDVCDNLIQSFDGTFTGRLSSDHSPSAPCTSPRSPIPSPRTSRQLIAFNRATAPVSEMSSRISKPNSSSIFQTLESLARCVEDNQDITHKDNWELDELSPLKSSALSLWTVPGYLSIQVHSGKCLSGDSISMQSSMRGSSPSHQAASGSVASAPVDVARGRYIVRVGLFHGSQPLTECQTTREMPWCYMFWKKRLNFPIRWADIPPAARLCVALLRLERGSEKRATKSHDYPVGWANVNFFDHQGFMISGEINLNLWPASLLQFTVEQFNRLYPAGTVLENPNPDFTLKLRILTPVQRPIQIPSFRSFIEAFQQRSSGVAEDHVHEWNPVHRATVETPQQLLAPVGSERCGFVNYMFSGGDMEADVDELETDNTTVHGRPLLGVSDYTMEPASFSESLLRELVTRDPLYELSEQEKVQLWHGRYFCLRHLPEALPWLAQSVPWNRLNCLLEFYHLLHSWPRRLPVTVALQLLGAMGLNAGSALSIVQSAAGNGTRGGASGIADANVRALAVDSLYSLSDTELSDYLLQLVQALKAESYLDNSLSRFILYRALRNPLLVGLRFFWHLRSEIHLPDMRVKFGLLLEAFCLGCGPLLTFLVRQVTALNRLEAISARVKELSNEDDQRARFRDEISRPEAQRDLQWLPSPLCLSERLGNIVISKCDVKRSKKRPLWLVWTNSDRLAAHHLGHYQLIFKHGDDLRQDMLTLQLLRVMDRIWKEEGMNMCLVPYGCLATGPEMGLIEAVRNARTVMSIQGDRLRAALQIDSTQLYKWLTQHITTGHDHASHSAEAFDRLIHNFTVSCAGYCVATFVLGIRDRHPDNIMVDTSGRLFHIDFGHILDNRKKKFGISRERVPFVLTKDFITVIARGNPDVVLGSPVTETGGGGSRNPYFQEFTQLCARAYMSLRKHANLLLTLLAMMLPSGLPELTSTCDLDYVRKTLAVELDEAQALAYFHTKFNEAYYGAWTTKIDWFGHWMNT